MYRFTSLARPIDPAYLTNRALLIVLPVVGLISSGLASFQDVGSSPLSAAFSGMLVAFAAWALTRELAPDFQGAAFVALALAWISSVALGTDRVLLLFVALVLVRAVNRSTGLPWRPFDTFSVLGFCAWAAINTQQPLILLIASVAFALDATLEQPLRLHLLAAAACLVVFAWMLMGGSALLAGDLALWDWALAGAFALGTAFGPGDPPYSGKWPWRRVGDRDYARKRTQQAIDIARGLAEAATPGRLNFSSSWNQSMVIRS